MKTNPLCSSLAVVLGSIACNLVDDDEPSVGSDTGDTGDTSGLGDNEACVMALETLDCPAGFAPQVHYDGGTSNVILVDDPSAQVGLGLGLLVHFGAGADADWVATQVTQNTVCTFGCFTSCPDAEWGCFADLASGNSCTMCGPDIDEQYCIDFLLACQGIDPNPGGTGGDDGGLDETGGGDEDGGADTSGEMAGYDCASWDPSTIYQLQPVGDYHVPQALLDQLVLGNSEPLAECDGVRFRGTSSDHWAIAAMNEESLLGSLGLQIGDELLAFDRVELDSLDAIAGLFVANFLTETGNPRRFSISDPGFLLRVRRGARRFVLGLRIDPTHADEVGSGKDGTAINAGR